MNERIRELESQCWETQQLTSDANSWHTSFNSRKFAELIVRECLSYAKEGDLDFMKFMIKQNFGVEE